jgi:methanogenic corrinoid protein MtbC1
MNDSSRDPVAARSTKYLLEAIVVGEKETADKVLEKWAKDHGYRSAIVEVLEPALTEIGKLWDQEKISLAAGYLAGKVAEDILNKAIDDEKSDLPQKGTAVIGNIEDDYHSLGRRLVGIFLSAAGWKVVDLGNDIPPAEFVDAAVTHGAQVIGASAMMHTTALNILGIRKELDARNLSSRIKLAVGGAIFKVRPDMVQEVGGDGTAANAVDVPELFDRLKGELV